MAQTGITDSIITKDLKETVITGNYTPRLLESTPEVIRVINAQEIKKMNASSLGDVLQYVSGISVETGTGSGVPDRSTVCLNGYPANFVLVLVDGVRLLTDHIHTGQNVDLVPLEAVERIEIIKGAASAQYGSDAMGGVINIITFKNPEAESATLFSSAGMHDTYSAGVNTAVFLKKKLSTSVFYSWEKSEGMPVESPQNRVGKMGYNRNRLVVGNKLTLGKNSDISAGLMFSNGKMDWSDGSKYNWLITSYIKSDNRISKRVRLHVNVPYSQWWAQQNSENNTLIQPQIYTGILIGKRNNLTQGLDFWYSSFTRTSVSKHYNRSYGAFIQDDYSILKNLIISANIRMDKTGDLPVVLSPKLSFVYYPWEIFGIRGAVSRGFHAPSMQELYEVGYGHGGSALRFGNPDLKPEYGMLYNLGFEIYPVNGLQFIISGYYNDIKNMITPVYQGPWDQNPSKDVWMRENINHAEIWGADFIAKADVIKNPNIETGLTYTYNQNVDTKRILPYFPGSKVYGKIFYNQPLGSKCSLGLNATISAVFNRSAWSWKPAAGTPRDDPNGLITKLKDYQLLNAGVNFRYKNWFEIYVNADNLLGQKIENLDDAFTVFKGEIFLSGGIRFTIE